MNTHSVSKKLFGIGFIAIICLVASYLVLGLVMEREHRYTQVLQEIAQSWGSSQTMLGPVLVFETPQKEKESLVTYVLPKDLEIESFLVPEIRSRGIFDSVVYTEKITVHGSFSASDIPKNLLTVQPKLVVSLSDTRSIEKQLALSWNNLNTSFYPGTMVDFFESFGVHAFVPLSKSATEYPFSFELEVKGSDRALFVPVGSETVVRASSVWDSPEFVGAYLPTERLVTKEGFEATWNVSSFGRSYPQHWQSDGGVNIDMLMNSQFGVGLYEGVGMYTQVFRSVKYAVLFILITFTAFFLFETLTKIRLHPVQYLLVGASLALFYLLLLSLTEHIGFLYAYILATVLTIILITTYSMNILKERARAGYVAALLCVLYGFMYVVLKLEDYALLFGSALIFLLIAGVMYLTRDIDWFTNTAPKLSATDDSSNLWK
ncbi:MAG: hypothetical protein UV60_C0003G0034 [Parcubacteria group bacterium GW2011_GWA2_43_11]|nr:MAG: hypothetical protein UV60_C0003G0034 [Parcubacteria group bacterium GW2011_GWA2_43_11]